MFYQNLSFYRREMCLWIFAILVAALLFSFSNFAMAGQLKLAWDASTQAEVAGYRLHYGNASRQYSASLDVGNNVTAILTGLTDGATYYIAVTAYNADHSVESPYSEEVVGTVPAAPVIDTTAPLLSNGSPSGVLVAGTSSVNMTVSTNENASCKYSYSAGVAYSSMLFNFANTGGLSHSSTVSGLLNGASYSIYVRCLDSSGNANINDYVVSFSISQPSNPLQQSLLSNLDPVTKSNSDGVEYELGMRFMATTSGTITAIKFYKSASESGTHIGKIYSSAGAVLASVQFTSESASGWQQASLSSPLSIAANTEYTVSVNTGNKYYVDTVGGLASQIVQGNLKSVVGCNGVYGSVGAKPSSCWSDSNYFRDIVFVPNSSSQPVADTVKPEVKILNLTNTSLVKVGTSVDVIASATDAVGVTKVEFYVNNVYKTSTAIKDSAGNYVFKFNVPPKRRGKYYQLQIKAYDAAGNIGSAAVTVKSY